MRVIFEEVTWWGVPSQAPTRVVGIRRGEVITQPESRQKASPRRGLTAGNCDVTNVIRSGRSSGFDGSDIFVYCLR